MPIIVVIIIIILTYKYAFDEYLFIVSHDWYFPLLNENDLDTQMNKSTQTLIWCWCWLGGGVTGRCHRYLELCQCICMYSNCSWIIYYTAATAADTDMLFSYTTCAAFTLLLKVTAKTRGWVLHQTCDNDDDALITLMKHH